MISPRESCWLLLLLIGLMLCPALTYGQTSALPNKPVRIIVPNAAGGPNDLAGRIIAPKLSEALRQSVVVENRASANGVTGSEYVAHADAGRHGSRRGQLRHARGQRHALQEADLRSGARFRGDQRNHVQQPGAGCQPQGSGQ